jgi:DNA-binding response OmpR family regulator
VLLLPESGAGIPSSREEVGLTLLPQRRAVRIGGREAVVTPTQFRLLALLVESDGRTLSRAELVERAIGTVVLERTVDVHVKELRRRLGPHGAVVEAVRCRGYRYRPPPEPAPGGAEGEGPPPEAPAA